AAKFNIQLVIAPRGMLHGGGLQKSTFKKTIYLKSLSLLVQQKRTAWHATDVQEISDIKTWFGQSSTIHLASDTPRPLPEISQQPIKQNEALRLVYYSLITSKKNLYLLLKALTKIKFAVSLDIYGPIIESSYWDECLAVINSLPNNITISYKGNVLFADFAKTAPNYHFMMLPSKGENFGHVIYEALSLGLPVVISRFTPWNFVEGSIGYYVSLEEESIAQTIEKIQQLNAEAYQILSRNARNYAETFYKKSIETCQDQYGTIFKNPSFRSGNPKPILLILYDYFIPGFKAGGPIQSLGNLVILLQDKYDFRIVTQGYDLGNTNPYDGILLDEWNDLYFEKCTNPISVFYTKKGGLDFWAMHRLLKQIKPDVVYINGIYTFRFALQPLLLSYFAIGSLGYKIVVCPRGMLQLGALSIKPFKKKIYLLFLKLSGILKHISWHATNADEMEDIRHFLGNGFKAQIAHNIPRKPVNQVLSSNKKEGELHLVYLSLISAKKNLDFLIKILLQCKGSISLDIYGPIKERNFWNTCKELINKAPKNISIHYKGFIEPQNVQQTLAKYHALALLTKGENFGHALVESWGVARPIITSSNTPWHFLEDKKAGWILPIDNIELAALKMDAICDLNEHNFMKYNNGAYQVVKQYFAENNFEEEYQQLFAETPTETIAN
ncbi:MAG: glycosyltransferase, partial [Pedobacter sp.]|nr:glycosyltransferase [Chitinophagaceae bacterium]